MDIDKTNRKDLIDTFLAKNQQINLSSIRDEDWVFVKHILDSLELNKILKLDKGYQIADIGTGWGFPLLPLAISNPNSNFTWIESVGKKVNAVNDIIASLKVTNANVLWSRSEDHKWKYDIITARAVSYVDKLFPLIVHLLAENWRIILYKMYSEQEDKDIRTACYRKNLFIQNIHDYKLFEEDIQRRIYLISQKKS